MEKNNSLIVLILFVFILSSIVAGGFFYYQENPEPGCVGAWSEWTECPTRFSSRCGTTETRNRTFHVISGVCDFAHGAREEQVCLKREPPADCVPQTTSYGFPVD